MDHDELVAKHARKKGEGKILIEQIKNYLNEDTEDEPTRHLWNLLTALRGPDSGDVELKRKTTMKIRRSFGLFEDTRWLDQTV